jgi:hypothetical protein
MARGPRGNVRRRSWYKAGLIVTCSHLSYQDQFIADPVVVLEVLFPTTSAIEFNRKLPEHQRMPSMRGVLPVSSLERLVRKPRRAGCVDRAWAYAVGEGPPERVAGRHRRVRAVRWHPADVRPARSGGGTRW